MKSYTQQQNQDQGREITKLKWRYSCISDLILLLRTSPLVVGQFAWIAHVSRDAVLLKDAPQLEMLFDSRLKSLMGAIVYVCVLVVFIFHTVEFIVLEVTYTLCTWRSSFVQTCQLVFGCLWWKVQCACALSFRSLIKKWGSLYARKSLALKMVERKSFVQKQTMTEMADMYGWQDKLTFNSIDGVKVSREGSSVFL